MLKEMRRHARYFYVLFVVVILTFIFWGVGRVDNNGQAAYVIEAGNDRVSAEEYWRAYDRVSDLYRDVYKERFDDKMREELKNEVLENMLEEVLLLHAAEKAGVSVSDRELEDAITHDPTFMRDGAFSSDVYHRTLEMNRLTPAIYEAAKRREMTVAKMRRLIEDPVEFTPEELEGLKGADERLLEAVRPRLLESKKKAVLKSYLEGIKSGIEVKVNKQLVS